MKLLALVALLLSVTSKALADDGVPVQIGPDGRGHTVETAPNGNVTYGTFQMKPKMWCTEIKQVDKAGNVLQWYQTFLDGQGREIMTITRKGVGKSTDYEGIASVEMKTYNAEGNMMDHYLYLGNGKLVFHTVNVYGWFGKLIRVDSYDSEGNLIGSPSKASR